MNGKLKLAGNKKTWLLIREDGKEMQVPARALTRSLFPLDPKKHDGLDVEYDLDKGQPVKVYEVGAAWQPQSQPTPAQGERRPGQQPSGGPRGGAGKPPYQTGRGERPQRQHSDRQPTRLTLKGEFHNPYNFIPAPPRDHIDGNENDLGNRMPAGHDHYVNHFWSGRIAVRLTTQSPLLILDAARAEPFERDPDHKIFPTRIDADGLPYLTPTSIKGVLRSAYEAVTNSRLAVFEKHQDRLAFRMQAKLGPVPARVEERNGRLGLRIMQQADVIGDAAKLPRYQESGKLPRDKGESYTALRYRDGELPCHSEPVWVSLNHSTVREIQRRTSLQPPPGMWQAGWVYVSGPNINRKRYERVFLEGADDDFILVAGEHEKLWRELIQNYKDTHQRDLENRKKRGKPQEYLGHAPGDTGWSRHIYEPGAERLSEGTLCYVVFDKHDGSRVEALIPVTISRRLFEVDPDTLLPQSLKPAKGLTELSPADRVFGWVNQNGKGAYRGNLRIGPVRCITPEPLASFRNPGVPLAILGQPKPQQSRFYVAQSLHGEARTNGFSKEEGYEPGRGLRGRKVYPHHANLPQSYWEEPWEDRTQKETKNGEDIVFFQEYRRPHKPEPENFKPKLNRERQAFVLKGGDENEQRDDQNRSIAGWVKPQTVFEFEMDITNLSEVELGALLWMLSLPPNHFHRLGGGKPLGFGSVRLEVAWEQTDLRTGAQWREAYFTLDEAENSNRTAAQTCIEEFRRAVAAAYGNGNFEKASFIAAFQSYTKGFFKPVHYPRALQDGQQHNSTIPPHPEGKAFEWFVTNERTARGNTVYGLSLPNLVDDDGLPILEAR